jgi:glycosyltransferase involved in cell wall biosynthesis
VGSDLPLKILYVVPYVPNRIRTRPFHLLKVLASEGNLVTLATLWGNLEELAGLQQLAKQLEGVLAERIGVSSALWNCIRAFPKSQPIQASYSWSSELARRITQLVKSTEFDVIHIEHLRGVRYGLLLNQFLSRRGGKNPPVIWDSVDCISRLFRQAAQESFALRSRLTTRLDLARTERFEGWSVTQFSRILVTSETDRNGFLELAANWRQRNQVGVSCSMDKRVAVVPNGVDLDYFSPNGETREPSTLVITGKMSYHANVTSVVQFVKQVMPRVWARLPQTRLWIVGKDPSREIRDLGVPWGEDQSLNGPQNGGRETRIQITGTVKDLRPFLRRATLAVAPIRYGVGIQNKVLEAMACGTPVVATPQAISALEVSSGRDLIVAKTPADLSEALVSLLRNSEQRSKLGQAGRSFVERRHHWSSIVRGLTQIYREAACEI